MLTYSYNQGAPRPQGGALSAPVWEIQIRTLRALMPGRRATRACAAAFRHENINILAHYMYILVAFATIPGWRSPDSSQSCGALAPAAR